MSEWQPAVFLPKTHFLDEPDLAARGTKPFKIHVRKMDHLPECVSEFRACGCKSEEFFIVRDDSCVDDDGDHTGNVVCACQILTD